MSASESKAAIACRGIAKRFGQNEVLAGLDLFVPAGAFISIIGASGCGKSTLLRLIAGLVDPDAGAITLFGEPPEEATRNKLIGFVPQSPALLPWLSVLDNVALPLKINPKTSVADNLRDPRAILDAFGLGDVLERRPRELSGGMAQRVAIARAFSFGASVLVMDEPFSALDELTREVLRRELLEHCANAQKTVVFVTHSVTEAVLMSDAVVVMAGAPGRVVAQIPVTLERPRAEFVELTEDFVALERRVRLALKDARTP